jgi:hypothetical protein
MYNCKLNCVVVTIARVSALEVVKISKDKKTKRVVQQYFYWSIDLLVFKMKHSNPFDLKTDFLFSYRTYFV